MEIIAACMLGFLSGAIVAICAVYFYKSAKPTDTPRAVEENPNTEHEKWQEQFEKMLNYNGREGV